jgi:hypothetical protein
MKTIQLNSKIKKRRISSSNYHIRGARKMTYMNTVKMVESSIKKSEVYPTELQLWHSLPEKTSRITLKRILMQLEKDNKIVYDKKDGSIIWTFTETPEARQSLRESVLLR